MADAAPAPRSWPAIDLELRPDAAAPADLDDRLALAFDDVAAVAVDGDGARRWRAYFDTADARQRALAELAGILGPSFRLAPADVEDEGWAVKVQQDLGPVRAGRFLVAPPWDVPVPAPDEVLIVIEPSVGFGTGHHQSTRLCLRALERLAVAGRTVADIGTGSGVLAIAAARLGARSVLALDHDEDAVGAARDNVARNGAAGVVSCAVADIATADVGRHDIVIANLTVHLLRRFARQIAASLRGGGTLVTSGFTTDQVALVLDAFPGVVVVARDEEDDWASLTVENRK